MARPRTRRQFLAWLYGLVKPASQRPVTVFDADSFAIVMKRRPSTAPSAMSSGS